MSITKDEEHSRVRANFNGSGDILVFTARFKGNDKVNMLALANGSENEIGAEFEGDPEDIEEDILLEFKKLESVDVVIDKLEKIKENLSEDSKPVIYQPDITGS